MSLNLRTSDFLVLFWLAMEDLICRIFLDHLWLFLYMTGVGKCLIKKHFSWLRDESFISFNLFSRSQVFINFKSPTKHNLKLTRSLVKKFSWMVSNQGNTKMFLVCLEVFGSSPSLLININQKGVYGRSCNHGGNRRLTGCVRVCICICFIYKLQLVTFADNWFRLLQMSSESAVKPKFFLKNVVYFKNEWQIVYWAHQNTPKRKGVRIRLLNEQKEHEVHKRTIVIYRQMAGVV